MKDFHKLLEREQGYDKLLKSLKRKETPFLVTGASDIVKSGVISSVFGALDQPIHVVAPNDTMGNRITNDINALCGNNRAVFFPTRELVLREVEGASLEYEHIRLGILGNIIENRVPIVVSTIESSTQLTVPPNQYKNHTLTLKSGDSHQLDELVSFFINAGYQRCEQVEGVSQFAVRGGILDIMPSGELTPCRVEFWGDEIDTISTFEILSQRRIDSLDSVLITPAREALITNPVSFIKSLEKAMAKLQGKYGVLAKENIRKDIDKLNENMGLVSADRYLPILYQQRASLFDYCVGRTLFVLEPISIAETYKNAQWQINEDIKLLLSEGILFPSCDTFSVDYNDFLNGVNSSQTVIMDTFNRSIPDLPLKSMSEIKAVQLSLWSGDYALLKDDLDDYMVRGYCVAVLAGTQKSAAALANDLINDNLPASLIDSIPVAVPNKIFVLEGGLSAGFEYPDIKFALITQSQNKISTGKKRRKSKDGKKIRSISDLTVGDYVVHSSHGIGVFQGIVKRTMQNVVKDYIKIAYAGTDTLFVPVTQLDLVSKYIGAAEGVKVKLNKLNSVEWQKTRSKVKGAVKEMAKELTALYAKRMNASGFAFSADNNWQQEFEGRFPYEETDDQLRSIEEIKGDMEKPHPMDRLLCGDVGFGKTEVALRAIFKCVMDGKQCAVLVPTTILAWQHYQTFLKRLEHYPVKIELLSRFRTAKQQKEIIKQLKRGEVDVVVGTHRVVQKDIEFKDLGLCVVDEEQRFGVAHKEKFKEMRADVDVLTLSATPIPRTLNMAMSGIRDMSLIEEAPQDRHPVQTYVLEYDQGIIVQAIQKELRRGGQVFYLHNRVQSIDSCAARLQKALPDAKIVTAHGKMDEESMSEVWRQLMEHEADILVCTTIIETGVDVPNCNTLIIENSDNYGLSQLYQLRGRVGRSTRRAYAYFTFQRGKALSEIATKRLSAIREFTTFGSGFRIAMRDLEIRGAGNVLGAQQHGHMASVGYDLYLKLLAEAVKEETGQEMELPTECIIDIQVDAHIPEQYIDNLNQRIDIYKKIAAIQTEEDSLDVMDELIDRFGDPPKSVQGLVEVGLIRGMASKLGITEINQNDQRILLYPEILDLNLAGSTAAAMGGKMLVSAGTRPYYSVKLLKGDNPVDILRDTLQTMASTKDRV